MPQSRFATPFLVFLGVMALGYAAVVGFFAAQQRAILYQPTHAQPGDELAPWVVAQETIGYCFEVADPRTVWLALPGNAGQASQRSYYRKRMRAEDSLFVLDYPGYGTRPGRPSRGTVDAAATAALAELRRRFPNRPIGVLGDSFGSGPACALAGSAQPPDLLVLAVPYDRLSSALQHLLPFVPWRLVLRDNWDNVAALRSYRQPVTIFAAAEDRSIPPERARRLAESLPHARFVLVPGGHGEWMESDLVLIGP